MIPIDVRGFLTAVQWCRGPGDMVLLDPREVGLVLKPVLRPVPLVRGSTRRLGLRNVTRS